MVTVSIFTVDMFVNVLSVYCIECHSENEVKPRDPIRCQECGYRIMYKKRTKRSILIWEGVWLMGGGLGRLRVMNVHYC